MKFVRTEVNRFIFSEKGYGVEKVEGYLYGTSGLNLTKTKGGWRINHEKSGYAICELQLPFALVSRAVVIVATILDWTLDYPSLQKQLDKDSKPKETLKTIAHIERHTAIETLEMLERR